MKSLWMDTNDAPMVSRPSLPGDVDADVAIVGAGYTGLWTAYELARSDPSLRVVVCEAENVGFGASGRNGGWCSAFFAGAHHDREKGAAMQRAMFATLDEIERAIDKEDIACDWARGGCVKVATLPVHVERIKREIAHHRAEGFGDDDWRWLEPDEARERINCQPNLGAYYTPHCAAIHPAKLVHGLAAAVERAGVTIYEHSGATSLEPHRVHTRRGTVRAEYVVRATEAFTPALPGYERALVPVYSLMIATEPLPDEFWADAGLAARETFADARHMVIYGQRTADGRFAFGGRGAPYHFGSRVRGAFDENGKVHAQVEQTLRSLFPKLGDAQITHRWGGAVAIPRDWYPSVGLDRATGMAWAGGYVGDGVATTNLAGRTLADLVLGRDTDLTHLPWVNHQSPRWEPEPLRWLGINGTGALIASIDKSEANGKQPKRRNQLVARVLG